MRSILKPPTPNYANCTPIPSINLCLNMAMKRLVKHPIRTMRGVAPLVTRKRARLSSCVWTQQQIGDLACIRALRSDPKRARSAPPDSRDACRARAWCGQADGERSSSCSSWLLLLRCCSCAVLLREGRWLVPSRRRALLHAEQGTPPLEQARGEGGGGPHPPAPASRGERGMLVGGALNPRPPICADGRSPRSHRPTQ
jgi:hypothetical protein